jgi:hypothetical protein
MAPLKDITVGYRAQLYMREEGVYVTFPGFDVY